MLEKLKPSLSADHSPMCAVLNIRMMERQYNVDNFGSIFIPFSEEGLTTSLQDGERAQG